MVNTKTKRAKAARTICGALRRLALKSLVAEGIVPTSDRVEALALTLAKLWAKANRAVARTA